MSKSLCALMLAGLLAVLAPAPATLAQSQPPTTEDQPSALAREAIDKMVRALSLVIQNLPQYAMPEINERGDIIIRRLNPRAESPRRAPDGPDETRT